MKLRALHDHFTTFLHSFPISRPCLGPCLGLGAGPAFGPCPHSCPCPCSRPVPVPVTVTVPVSVLVPLQVSLTLPVPVPVRKFYIISFFKSWVTLVLLSASVKTKNMGWWCPKDSQTNLQISGKSGQCSGAFAPPGTAWQDLKHCSEVHIGSNGFISKTHLGLQTFIQVTSYFGNAASYV